MSQENVETVKRTHDAWATDNLEAFLAQLHPDVEWHPSIEPALEGKATTYIGHEGARRAWGEYRGEAFEGLTVQVHQLRDLGESVLLLGRFVVTGRETGIELDSEFGQVLTFRDGKIGTAHDFLSHREALEAAGLSEQAMSQENVEIVRTNIDAFNRGDYEEALAVLDQDVEWHVPDVAALDAPASGMVRGRERVAEVFSRWLGAWDPFSFEVTEILGHGEKVFLAGLQVAHGRHSGVDVSVPTFHVCTLRDRRIVVMQTFPDRAAALEAAGLSE